MKLYLSGPMTGLPDLNFPAFEEAAGALRAKGHEVFSPHEIEGPTRPWAEYLRIDLRAVLDAEAVAYLPGWARSKGAKLEIHVATELGMPVLSVDEILSQECGRCGEKGKEARIELRDATGRS